MGKANGFQTSCATDNKGPTWRDTRRCSATSAYSSTTRQGRVALHPVIQPTFIARHGLENTIALDRYPKSFKLARQVPLSEVLGSLGWRERHRRLGGASFGAAARLVNCTKSHGAGSILSASAANHTTNPGSNKYLDWRAPCYQR